MMQNEDPLEPVSWKEDSIIKSTISYQSWKETLECYYKSELQKLCHSSAYQQVTIKQCCCQILLTSNRIQVSLVELD